MVMVMVHQLIGHSPIQHLMIGLQLLCVPPFFYTHNLYKKLHQVLFFFSLFFFNFFYIFLKGKTYLELVSFHDDDQS